MAWTVTSKKKAQKQAQKLPSDIKKILARFLMEIEIAGPFRSNWQNEVIDKEIRLVEVSYVGTHEKAPY
ncbi:MAG: cytotoxic translational repressor of toxin-antitoxin stability system [Deltaproteobacteria bacterium]|nr:cytotoxic translational repressor of toxin-antitoxin stability system [Deltaproteobacteria bacterium]